MSEQRKRMKKALRGCAEAGVPETVDLWPSIRERTVTKGRHSSARLWFVPHTRVGWVFTVLAALFVMTGAGFAAAGLVYARFQEELPGAEARDVGKEIGQEQTIDGARITLEWAYADEEFVVLSYSVKDLQDDRLNSGHRVQLEPVFVGKEDVEAGRGPDQRATLTDEGGRELGMIDGTFEVAGPGDGLEVLGMSKSNSAVFKVPEGLKAGRRHRFHLEIPLEEMPVFSSMEEGEQGVRIEPRPPIGPFVFDFELPVRPAPTAESDQKVEKNGVVMTLNRVVNSPARPQAVICFESPDDKYDEWHPTVEPYPADREPIEPLSLGNGCWSAPLYDRMEGRSSLTVTELMGIPGEDAVEPEMMQPEMLPGPWKFEFEVPER